MKHIFKGASFLLFVAITFSFGSCKKQEAQMPSNLSTTDAHYLPIGTLLKRSIANGNDNVKKGEARVSWMAYGYPRYPQMISGDYTTLGSRIGLAENGLYSVEFQGDGNLVVYKLGSPNGSPIKALWATNKYNIGVSKISFETGGNIYVIRNEWNGANTYLWAAGTGGHSGSAGTFFGWVIQDDGNFVGYPIHWYSPNDTYAISGPPFADTGTWGDRVAQGGKINKIY